MLKGRLGKLRSIQGTEFSEIVVIVYLDRFKF